MWDNFADEEEFIDCVSQGNMIEFTYNNRDYVMLGTQDDRFAIQEAFVEESEAVYDTVEAMLSHVIEGKPLRDILCDMLVTFRGL